MIPNQEALALRDKGEFVAVLKLYGYELVSRRDFNEFCAVPGLRERADGYPGDVVVYDPDDDSEGFLLVGEDRQDLAKKAVESLELGEWL